MFVLFFLLFCAAIAAALSAAGFCKDTPVTAAVDLEGLAFRQLSSSPPLDPPRFKLLA